LHRQSAAASLPGGLALKAGQASHAWSPRPALKALAGQAAQAPEDQPAPAAHTHAAALALAAAAVVSSAAQSVHAAEPAVSLYLPTAQAWHGPPFGPVWPALHAQAAAEALAAGLLLEAGHGAQASALS
jgi:hypothetical protein